MANSPSAAELASACEWLELRELVALKDGESRGFTYALQREAAIRAQWAKIRELFTPSVLDGEAP